MSLTTSHPEVSVGISQCKKILVTYLKRNRTDDEAAKAARLYVVDCCYWKRCRDLRKAGWITWVVGPNGRKVKRKSSTTGHKRGVCELTPKGRRLAEALKKNPKTPFSL